MSGVSESAVLEVRGARHRFGSTVALDGVDLRVDAGECVALLGPNGAGKTTLVGQVTGLLGSGPGTVLQRGTWVLVPVTLAGALMNFASPSPWERFMWAPVTLTLAGLCFLIAREQPSP